VVSLRKPLRSNSRAPSTALPRLSGSEHAIRCSSVLIASSVEPALTALGCEPAVLARHREATGSA